MKPQLCNQGTVNSFAYPIVRTLILTPYPLADGLEGDDEIPNASTLAIIINDDWQNAENLQAPTNHKINTKTQTPTNIHTLPKTTTALMVDLFWSPHTTFEVRFSA